MTNFELFSDHMNLLRLCHHPIKPLRIYSLPLVSSRRTKATLDDEKVLKPIQSQPISKKFNDYLSLGKPKLSLFVLLTANAGYCIVNTAQHFSYSQFWLGLSLGTYLCSLSANTFNQVVEVPYDTQMTRTQSRPIVKGTISPGHATAFGVGLGATGTALLYSFCNLPTAVLGAANIFIYAGAYTSMKRKHWLNTQVGAIVGAIPPIMGATSTLGAAGLIHPGALSLSAILFFWQFPHFYALCHG